MPKKRKRFSDRVFQRYNELRAPNDANMSAIGRAIAKDFPELFKGMNGRSVVSRIRDQAAEYGVEIAAGKEGGRKRASMPSPDRRWVEATPEITLPYSASVIVLSDIHFPMHSVAACERAIEVARSREIKTVVFNGDLLDNGYKGHHGTRTKWAPTFDSGLEAARDFISLLIDECPHIETIAVLCGNHDDRPFRETDREWEFIDLMSKVFEGMDTRDITVHVTNRYYIWMEPKEPKAWPWVGPENFPTIFTHQKEYGRSQLGVAKRLGDVEPANTFCGHQHHLAVGKHPNGLMYVVDCGTLQDPDTPAYKNARQTTHPKWSLGFITLIHGVPEAWAMSNPPEWWNSRLGAAHA